MYIVVDYRRFRLAGKLVHHMHAFCRISARRRFARKHYRVGTVEYGVRHIRDFRPRRSRISHHGIKHLRRRHDYFTGFVTLPYYLFLRDRHIFLGNFNAEIAARYHNAVRYGYYFIYVAESLPVFDLGNYPDLFAAVIVEKIAYAPHIFRISYE